MQSLVRGAVRGIIWGRHEYETEIHEMFPVVARSPSAEGRRGNLLVEVRTVRLLRFARNDSGGQRPLRQRMLMGILLALALSLVWGCSNPASKHIERGNSYRSQGQLQEAVVEFSKAIELAPDMAQAYYLRSCAYGDMKEWDLAVADMDKAIELESDNSTFLGYRGALYSKRGQHMLALRDLDKAVALGPPNAWIYFKRGAAHFYMLTFDLAIADLSKAIEMDPTLVEAYNLRAQSYSRIGQHDLAYADWGKALDLTIEAEKNKGSR
ncbi:MAG: tetratricopeptide repeat protein [Chloroflexi bacterium]|nr:tetratricopeptide repeat protein [Chloroflexota bacterium]MBM3175658.1 tetratricopeptide repeat protein [Chloroflexota bacterium]